MIDSAQRAPCPDATAPRASDSCPQQQQVHSHSSGCLRYNDRDIHLSSGGDLHVSPPFHKQTSDTATILKALSDLNVTISNMGDHKVVHFAHRVSGIW